MKTIVVFYSYTGHTRKLAQDKATKEGADIYEIKEKKLRSKLQLPHSMIFSYTLKSLSYTPQILLKLQIPLFFGYSSLP